MSHSQRNPRLYYDQFDSRGSSSASTFVQISLPSTRIEVPMHYVLFKDNGQRVEAHKIRKHDYLMVMRDEEKVSEIVNEVKRVEREFGSPSGSVQDGFIIVNNVPMQHR